MRSFAIAATLAFAVAVLAGCSSPPADTAPPPPPTTRLGVVSFLPPVKVGGGVEPGLRLAGNGTIYVHVPGDLFKSTDNGANWTSLSAELNAALAVQGGDADLAIGKDGSLYYTDLESLAAISVYTSHDKGATWTANADASDLPGDDRMWIEAGPDAGPLSTGGEALYLTFNNEGANVVVSKSTDAGKTWVSIPVNHGVQTQFWAMGNLVVDPKDGTVWVMYDLGNGLKPLGGQVPVHSDELQVARSTDGGLTWTIASVAKPSGDSGQLLPSLAEDKAGNLYAVWGEQLADHDDIKLSVSKDQGATWSPAAKVNQMPKTAIMPWIAATGVGNIAISYYGANETAQAPSVNGSWTVWLAESRNAANATPMFDEFQVWNESVMTGGICTTGITCPNQVGPIAPPGAKGSRALADFFQVRLDAQGAAHLAFADNQHQKGTATYYTRQVSGPRLDTTGPATPAK